MSCIRYGEGGKGMADGGCSVSSIEGVHDSYIVVISGRWIMYDIGDWDFKLDSDRMGRAVYAKLITSVEALKRAILESYGLVGTSVAVEMSYWLREHGSCAVGEREAPVQISNDKDFDLFTSARKVDKYINVFVTFKEEVDGKILYMRPMENLLKSKEVASSNEMQVGSTSADVHTRNEVNDGETDLTEDEIILMGVAEIEAVYASNGFGMREVDGTTCEVQNKVDTAEDAALGEGEDDDDEDYDYNLWHDFVGRNCEWDDDKDDDGGVGGGCRTNVTYGGHTANPPSTFKDYVDEGRDYIGSSRISMENIEEASNNLGVKSSDQVADTENHSDPNQEEDPSLDNNSQMSCTCLEFQKVGIPCRHAIAAAMFRNLKHSEFVADAYLKKTWNETTKGVTLPVPDPQDIFIPSEVSDLIMLPPKTKIPPGRPPTKRKRSAGEIPVRPNLI
ncbi:unnamed protein product [Brassica napus]|uniref:(rape) hypothetical protein n=1 Tax=Brassica napus TaxID=3708 RepID=A0A816ZQI9_BRANA|nr:unnamed protein product [Brassica napus]